MKRVLPIILFLWALFAFEAPAQTILGKSPVDKLLPGFLGQNTNASSIVIGLNLYAVPYSLGGGIIEMGTINSNQFDANTLAALGHGTGGSVPSGLVTNRAGAVVTVTNTGVSVSVTNAGTGISTTISPSALTTPGVYSQGLTNAGVLSSDGGAIATSGTGTMNVEEMYVGNSAGDVGGIFNLYSTEDNSFHALNINHGQWSFGAGEDIVVAGGFIANNVGPNNEVLYGGAGVISGIATPGGPSVMTNDASGDLGWAPLSSVGGAVPSGLVTNRAGAIVTVTNTGVSVSVTNAGTGISTTISPSALTTPGVYSQGLTNTGVLSSDGGAIATSGTGTMNVTEMDVGNSAGDVGGILTLYSTEDNQFHGLTINEGHWSFGGGGDIVVAGGFIANNVSPNEVLESGAGVISGVGTGTGVLTNDGAGNLGWLSLSGLGGGSQSPWTATINGGGNSATNIDNLSVTNNLTVFTLEATTMTVTDMVVIGIDLETNSYGGANTFWLGTNETIATSSDVDLSSLGNLPGSTARDGQLNILAGANINVTNPPSWYATDGQLTRVLTNGDMATILVEVQPGEYTNFVYVWSLHH